MGQRNKQDVSILVTIIKGERMLVDEYHSIKWLAAKKAAEAFAKREKADALFMVTMPDDHTPRVYARAKREGAK